MLLPILGLINLCGLAMLHKLAGGNPVQVIASHEPCRHIGNDVLDAQTRKEVRYKGICRLYNNANSDDGFLEIFSEAGISFASAHLWADAIESWDIFFMDKLA
jgi:hypothetical protein